MTEEERKEAKKVARKEVTAFIEAQTKKFGLKRSEVARSLFAKGYSTTQVAFLMDIHPKTAHAMKIDFTKKGKEVRNETGHPAHMEIKGFIRNSYGFTEAGGKKKKGEGEFKTIFSKINFLCGEPYHVVKAREEAKA